MENRNFKQMNAEEVASRIIAAEVAYLHTDYESLSFEERCGYALEYSPILHPILAPAADRRAAMLEELRPELLLRAEKEDGFALYVLGSFGADLSVPASDDERRLLERAVDAGFYKASIDLVARFLRGKGTRKQALHGHLIPALNRLVEEGKSDTAAMHAVTHLLSELESNGESRLVFSLMARELAEKMVLGGSYVGLTKLCLPCSVKGTCLKSNVSAEELTFWQTVDFLVHSRLFDAGALHLGDALRWKLINARGCEREEEGRA